MQVKITDLRVFQMQGAHANWTFVKLYTDKGITGVGEASLERFNDIVASAVESLKGFVIGKDPFQIEYIWNAIYKSTFWHGGVIVLSALSAIEQALWDIKGKALDVPIYEFFGGKLRDKVRAYANAWAFQETVTEMTGEDTPDSIAENALKMVDKGFTAMKWDPFRDGGQVIPKSEEEFAVACVERVREAVGPSIDILIECHGRFNMNSAIRMAQKLEPFDPFFYEEPIPPDNIDAMAEVQRSINLPVATGERLFTRWDFRGLLEKQAARIIQPDICHVGGFMELKKVAAMAESYYVSVQPHNSNGPLCVFASLHIDATIPNCQFQEFFFPYLDLYNQILTEPIRFKDGFLEIPSGPGLGTDINEEFILSRPPAPQPQMAPWVGEYWPR